MTTTTPPKVEYHKGYDDPTADMVIKVNDGMKFRVDSYLLKAHSQFFRDMPDYDEEMCGPTPREIDFDANAETFALLLDLINARSCEAFHQWSDFEAVIEIGTKYHFLHLMVLVLAQMNARIPTGNPWKTFVIASNLDLPLIAKQALVHFGNTAHLWGKTVDEITPNDMEGLSGPCTTALLRAIRLNTARSSKVTHHPITGEITAAFPINWAKASQDFRQK